MNKRVTVTVELPRGEKERSGERLTQLGKTMRSFRAYQELMATGDWMREKMSRQLACLDLRLLEFRAMESLYHDGPQYQRELGQKISCGKQKIVHVLEMLEREGWVRRDAGRLPKSESNKRSERGRAVVIVRLTEEGERHIRNVFPKHAKMVKAEMKVLDGREQKTLAELCRKLREGDMVRYIKELTMPDAEEDLDWKR